MNQLENIISNYVPVLLEEDALETVISGGFIRLHRVKGSEDSVLGNRFGEGELTEVINDWVMASGEGAVMVRLGVSKKVLEIVLSFFLENGTISCPNAIQELESMDSIFLSSDDSLSMKERTIFVIKFDPFFSGFLIPKHFFLKKDVIVLLL